MTPHAVALIGCGRVGALLEDDPLREKPASHLGALRLLPRLVHLLAVCDSDADRLRQCQQRWQVPQAYLSYREMVLREKPEIVIIATWTQTHRDIALFCIEHGVRGLVLEKPLACNPRQGEEIALACAKSGVKLVINHERRWDPLYRQAKQIITSGTVGQLKTIVASVLSCSAPIGSWSETLDRVGGGPLLHDGTHLIDMIRYFAGEIVTVCGAVQREEPQCGTETSAQAMLQLASGVHVFLEAGGSRDHFHFELDLQCERGRVKVGNGIRELYVSKPARRYSGFRELSASDFPHYSQDEIPFCGAIKEVCSAISGASEPASSVLDGQKALEAIFAIYHSAAYGGKPVTVPARFHGHPLKKMFRLGAG